MDLIGFHMDNICVWTDKLLEYIERSSVPAIPFVGFAQGGFNNPPGPYVEFILTIKGAYRNVSAGVITGNMPSGSISLITVHRGNYTVKNQTGRESWGLFIDVSDIPAFKEFETRDLFCTERLRFVDRVRERFESLALLCQRRGRPAGGYKGAERLMFNPDEKGYRISKIRIKAALLELMAEIFQQTQKDTDQFERTPESVRKAQLFMMQSFMYPDITLYEIAESANLSIDHFGRQFRKHTGMSPVAWLNRIRMDKASILLRQTSMRVNEVAREVGFEDPLYFTRVFRKIVGMSPSAFREKP